MNLDVLNHFLLVAELKSIAKASEKLNLTHPALSKQIRKLEDYYGAALFVRSAAGVELTAAGKLLFERAPQVLTELETIQSDIRALSDTKSKKIKLGILPSLAAHYAPQRLIELESAGFQIHLTVEHTSEQLLDLLHHQTIDAAIVDAALPTGFFWNKPLFTEPFFVIVPSSHEFAEKHALSIADISRESFIMYPPSCSIRRCVTELFAQQGASPLVKTEIPFGEFILGYTAAGAGICIVPEIVASHMNSSLLRAVPLADPRASRTVSLLAVSEAQGKHLARYFK